MIYEKLHIVIEPEYFSWENINKICGHYDAKYVCSLHSYELFYSEEPHPVSKSRYFIIFNDRSGTLNISSGKQYDGYEIDSFYIPSENKIVYSRSRRDFTNHGLITVDGGPTSPRVLFTDNRDFRFARLKVIDGRLLPVYIMPES